MVILPFMTASLVPRLLAIGLLALLWVTPAESHAQRIFGLPASSQHDHATCASAGCDGLIGIPEDHFHFVPPPVATQRSSAATIQVEYINFPAVAQSAFQYAVNLWAASISSSVVIDVEANWASLGPNVLGSASPSTVHRNFSGAPNTNVYYPAALANQLAATDLQTNSVDITCNFGSDVNWYFGLDGNVPPGAYDFVTVVLHELCHGLGFIGSAVVAGSTGFIGQSGSPFVYDTFINDNNSGGPLLDINTGTGTLENALTGGGLIWSGPEGLAAAVAPPGIYAPNPWEPGASFSHLREDMYLWGDPNALMTPNLNTGEAIHDPGPIVMGMFADMGWGIEGCTISALLAGAQSPCNPATNTYSQQVILIYDDAPSGLLNVNGSLFTVTGSPQTVSLNNLPANGGTVDVEAFFTGDLNCSATVPSLFTAPEACGGGTCTLVSYALGAQSDCNPADNTYSQALTFQFAFSAGAGDLEVNGQVFPVVNDYAAITLENLPSDGDPVNLVISFTDDPDCAFAVLDAWTAPGPCPCSLDMDVSNVGECESSSHAVDFLVHIVNPPNTGLLDVAGNLFEIPPGSGSYTVTLDGFNADGLTQSAGAFFTDLPTCSTAEDAMWTAPEPCACVGDLDGDGIIGVSDTLDMLSNFGCVGNGCEGDLDGDTIVGVSDILELLSAFGESC